MSGASVRIAVVAIVTVVAFIMNSAAFAMSPRERCTKAFKTCSKRCGPEDFSMFCDCISRYDSCLQRHPPTKSSGSSTTTNTTPKGKGTVDTAPTGGDKQVGVGTGPSGKIRPERLNVDNAQQVQQSGTSGSPTILRTHKKR